jgi:hypothetical protein
MLIAMQARRALAEAVGMRKERPASRSVMERSGNVVRRRGRRPLVSIM